MSDFDPDKYLAEKTGRAAAQDGGASFDPDKYLAEKMNPRPFTPAGESLARGAAQGVTLGHADELVGLGEGAWKYLTDSGTNDFGAAYEKARDESRANFDKAQRDHPVAFGVGNVGGGLATALIPGLNIAKAGTVAGRIGTAALGGALAGEGFSKHDGTKGFDEAVGLAKDTGLGALIGAGTQGAFEAAAPVARKVAEKLPPALNNLAERRAFKAAVGNQQKVYDQAVKQGRVNEIGREVLDSGALQPRDVVNPLRTPARAISERAEQKAGEAWDEIERVFGQIDEAHPQGIVDPKDIAIPMLERAEQIRSPNTHAEVANLERQATEYVNKTPLSMAETQRLKNTYPYNPSDPFNVAGVGKRAIRDAQEKAIERYAGEAALARQTADEAAPAVAHFGETLATGSGRPVAAPSPGPSPVLREAEAVTQTIDPAQALTRYKAAKKTYGALTTAEEAAEKLANRQEKNQTFGLGEKILAAGAAAAKDPVKAALHGLTTAIGSKAVKERGSAALALAAERLSKAIQSDPGAFGKFAGPLAAAAKRGNGALAVTHTILMRDPEYRALFDNPDQEGKPSP